MVNSNPHGFPIQVIKKLQSINATVERVERMAEFFVKFHLSNGQVLHYFSDIDRGWPHNHPWPFDTEIIFGYYTERVFIPYGPVNDNQEFLFTYKAGTKSGRKRHVLASHIHLITDISPLGCYTLVTPGAWERESGFFRIEEREVYFRFWNEPDEAFRLIDDCRAIQVR